MPEKQPVVTLIRRQAHVARDLARVTEWLENGEDVYLFFRRDEMVRLRPALSQEVLQIVRDDLEEHARLIGEVLDPANAAAAEVLGD
ncbi:MAG: hypothetical protein ACOC9X_01370 [bacterium]